MRAGGITESVGVADRRHQASALLPLNGMTQFATLIGPADKNSL